MRLRQVRAAASWERLITSRTTARPEPRPGGPLGAGASWEMGPSGGGEGTGCHRAQLGDGWERRTHHPHRRPRGGRGRLCCAPRFKLQREKERGRNSASNPLQVRSALDSREEGLVSPTRSAAPCGKRILGCGTRGEEPESGRSLAAAVPVPPAAASVGWNVGNPRAEGSGRPPPDTASRAAAFPGCPLAPPQPPPGSGRRGRLCCGAGHRASPSPNPAPRVPGQKRQPGKGGREAWNRG